MAIASISPRTFLSLGLAVSIVGLASGCAHSRGAGTVPPRRNNSVVTAEDIERAPGQPIEKIVADRVPGVSLAQGSDGRLSLRIRGPGSFQSSNEPLYVIDGVPVEPGTGSGLSGINPHDVESIEVVKDAPGTTQYGVRGANGVIIVKTKLRNQRTP